MGNIKDKVSWIMSDEKMLKLEKLDKTYELSDNVLKFMESNNLLELEDFDVDVTIDESIGENGIITKLVKLANKKVEEKETSEPDKKKIDEETLSEKTMTVGGVAVEKKGIIFKEEDGVWYTLSDELDAEKIKTEATRKTVKVSIKKQDKGNDIITKLDIIVYKESSKPTSVKENTKNYSSSTQVSIETQVAVEHAQILAGKLYTSLNYDSSRVNIDTFIAERAKKNYILIQELKSL